MEIILNTPDPPENLLYADFEDYRALELLKVNNIEITENSLLAVLKKRDTTFSGTAAHVLAMQGSTVAVQELERLCAASEDLTRVEAAYALVRLGLQQYKNVLIDCLNYPIEAYLAPGIAAGNLARIGDQIGFPVLIKCFEVDNLIVRIVACKQLIFFIPFHGRSIEDGKLIDVYVLFDQALHDQHPEVQRIALIQLRELHTPETKTLLHNFILKAPDHQLRTRAEKILDQMND